MLICYGTPIAFSKVFLVIDNYCLIKQDIMIHICDGDAEVIKISMLLQVKNN